MKTQRLNYKYMMQWLQREFDRFEIEWEPFEMYYTALSSHQYENGAAVYMINIRSKDNRAIWSSVLVHDWLKSMQRLIATGEYKLKWQPGKRHSELVDSYITLEKV